MSAGKRRKRGGDLELCPELRLLASMELLASEPDLARQKCPRIVWSRAELEGDSP